MDLAQQSHQVTGQNLANVNTPGFKTQEIPFQQFLDRLDSGSQEQAKPYVLEDTPGLTMRADGNNVDLDREMAAMKKNALVFQTLTQLLGAKMGILKQAISR